MSQNNIALVKNSWALVAQLPMETVGELFYNRLFEIIPSVKPMFSRTPMPEQSKKLLTMLLGQPPINWNAFQFYDWFGIGFFRYRRTK